MSEHLPHRSFGQQVRTVMLWALIPIVLIAAPLIIILILSVDTSGDTEAIRTAQAQADRNLAVQACTTRYAATAIAWEDEADRIEARIIREALTDGSPDPNLGDLSVQATDNASEMTRRRIGLADLARDEVGDRRGGFGCPTIPARLSVEPLDPTDPRPPDH